MAPAAPSACPIPAAGLTAAIEDDGARGVTVVSTDLFYDMRTEVSEGWVRQGAEVVEMEAATLLALAAREGLDAAVVLAVTDLLADGDRQRIPMQALEKVGVRLGRAGYAALSP